MTFDRIIDRIIAREGGYTNHPADRGGPTNFGITEVVARANGYTGDMRHMPEALARHIYRARYITVPWFDRVWQISDEVGEELIDTGVNMGPAVASVFFQRWLTSLNARGSHYADLFPDGRIGNITLDAFRAYMARRGQEGIAVMVAALNCTQGVRYLEIAEKNPTQEDFLYGWLRTRVLHPAGDSA